MRTPFLPLLLIAFVSAAGCDQHKKKAGDEPSPEGRSAKGFAGGKGGGNEKDPASLDGKKLVADLGFRPKPNGFAFPNFRLDDPDNLPLGPKDLKKMCGEKAVCAGGDDDDECQLKAGAQAYLESTARLLGGGHCEGFSVGALRLWAEDDAADKLGSDKTWDLDRQKKVERYLAYWAASQMSPSVAKATFRAAPNKVLDRLITSMKNKSETYVLGIHRADGKGGHAIVPYAVEDRGNDIYWVYVYENNSPGKLRHVEFDKDADTWRYDDAATMTDEQASTYAGTSAHPGIELIPQSSRNKMACPFAPGASSSDYDDDDDKPVVAKKKKPQVEDDDEDEEEKVAKKKQVDEDEEDDDVMLVGRGAATLSVEDGEGHTLGVKDGFLVSEIPGATYSIPRGDSDMPPILYVPAKTKVKLTVRGDAGKKSDVAIIGRKFAANLTGVSGDAAPGKQLEIDGKSKQIGFIGGAPAAQKIELFFDSGKKVQKIELPATMAPIAVGQKLSLDVKKGKLLHLDNKGTLIKPVAAPLMVVNKPMLAPKKFEPIEAVGAGSKVTGPKMATPKIAAPKVDGPAADAPKIPGGKPIGIAPVKPADPAKPGVEPAKPGPTLVKPGVEPAKPMPKPAPVDAPKAEPKPGPAPPMLKKKISVGTP